VQTEYLSKEKQKNRNKQTLSDLPYFMFILPTPFFIADRLMWACIMEYRSHIIRHQFPYLYD